MAQIATSKELDVPQSRRRGGTKNIADLAADVLRDIADLARVEMQLLHAELSEKLTFAGLSACIVAVGALFLAVTVVLVLQAGIAGLVAYGTPLPAACLIVAGLTFILGWGLTWYGLNRLKLSRMVPSRTIDQLQKDTSVAKTGSI